MEEQDQHAEDTPSPAPLEKESIMAETQNFFDNPMGGGSGAVGAGVGGLVVGALLANNGGGLFGGNREPAVTPDQLAAAINGLQGQLSTDALQAELARISAQIAGSSTALGDKLGCEISGVKDAVVSGQAQTNLALCGLGHTMQAGFAGIEKTILLEACKGRELTLSENLSQARLALATAHSDAKHTATQVMIQNLVKA